VHGVWVRQTAAGVGGLEPGLRPSRWGVGGSPALYLADNDETAWAELYRGLAERGQPPTAGMPRDLHRVTVNLERVADLRSERARRGFGLPRIRPTRAQWAAFQQIGERLAAEGAQGVLYSSAARTRSLCLCVFEAGLAGLEVEGEPIRVIAAPPLPRGLRT